MFKCNKEIVFRPAIRFFSFFENLHLERKFTYTNKKRQEIHNIIWRIEFCGHWSRYHMLPSTCIQLKLAVGLPQSKVSVITSVGRINISTKSWQLPGHTTSAPADQRGQGPKPINYSKTICRDRGLDPDKITLWLHVEHLGRFPLLFITFSQLWNNILT